MRLSHLLYRIIKRQLLCFIFLFALTGFAKADLLADAANAYSNGEYKRAVIIFELLAEKGNAKAQTMLGVLYREGKVICENH